MTIALGIAASAMAGTVSIGPKNLPLKVGGVQVEIPVTASIEVTGSAGVVELRGTVSGDLRAIQAHALEIAHHVKLPKANCAHKGINVVVDGIDNAKITSARTIAVVDLSGRVSVWACEKILGMRTKAKIASERVGITVPVELVLRGGQTIALRRSGPAGLRTGGGLATDAARELTGDLTELLDRQLDKLLDTAAARATLPALPGLNVTIDDAHFVQNGAVLGVQARGHGKLGSTALQGVFSYFAK